MEGCGVLIDATGDVDVYAEQDGAVQVQIQVAVVSRSGPSGLGA